MSHETIYRSLFIQARGVLKKELLEHLRARRTIRRSRHASLKRNGLGQIKDAVSISERPRIRRRSRRPRPLGRRPDRWVQEQLRRHAGRASLALRDAGQGRQQGHRKRRLRPDQTVAETARRTLPIPDLGSGKELADHQRLLWPPTSRSTSAILGRPGSAAPTKTPTDCCASICLAAPTCPCIARPSSAPSHDSSTNGRERPCSIKPQRRSSPSVLQRSVEPAARSGPSGKARP